MTQETRMALLLLGELVTALRANDPDTFKKWLVGGIQDLGKPAVTELMADWMNPLLTQMDKDRLVASLSKGARGKVHSTFTARGGNRGRGDMVC